MVPTPQKGGKYLNYLCTEFCRFIVWCDDTIALQCDQEPSTLSLLEAVKKTCRCLGIRVLTEPVGPASHARIKWCGRSHSEADQTTSQLVDSTYRTRPAELLM